MFGHKKKKQKNKIIVRNSITSNSKKEKGIRLGKPNVALLILIIILLVAGVLMIFSASAVLAYVSYKDIFYFVKKQILWIVIGVVFAGILFTFNTNRLRKLSYVLIIIGFAFLLYLLPSLLDIQLPGVVTLNGATRWIRIPGVSDIQPAEFMKVAMILFISAWLTLSNKTKNNITKWIDKYKHKEGIHFILTMCYNFFPFIIIGLISLLILTEKDLDTLVVIVLTFICIYYAAGTKKQHTNLTVILIIASVILGTFAMVVEPYRRERVQSYLEILVKGEPENKQGSSFQVWNGLVAVGSGGVFGVGYGESRQKLFFLQEAAYTDSIFAVFAEEFGLLGSLLLILSFIYFTSLGLKVAKNSKDRFLSLVALGITSWISIQAFLNIASNLAVIPFGGMPLPFFTYGGSNTIMLIVAIGILLNISRAENTQGNSKFREQR